jgi:hypothetical protein
MKRAWNTSLARRAAAMLTVVALAACGGFGTDSIIGGTLSGLGTGLNVVIANNGTDNLTLSSNGSFVFPTKIAPGSGYSVAVVTQPLAQTCSVGHATGTVNVAGSDVDNVDVSCLNTSSVVVTVTGLIAGGSVTLSDGATQLPIAANGSFAFPDLLAPGTPYAVTVVIQPTPTPPHICTLSSNATGTIPASGIVAVTAACV